MTKKQAKAIIERNKIYLSDLLAEMKCKDVRAAIDFIDSHTDTFDPVMQPEFDETKEEFVEFVSITIEQLRKDVRIPKFNLLF